MAGLLAGAMAGLGQGVSDAGNFLLRAKADEVKEARLQKYEESVRQRTWNREDEQAAAAGLKEDAQRREERGWDLEDTARKEQHDLRVAGIRSSGRGVTTPSRITEAEMLVNRGVYASFEDAYNAVRASAGQLDPSQQAMDELEYDTGQLQDIMELLNDRAAVNSMDESEVRRLEERAEDIRARIPSLEQRAFGRQAAAPTPQPAPPPAPTGSGSNAPPRERGLLPGPGAGQEGDIGSSADAILNKFF